jgi:hypothetical protein
MLTYGRQVSRDVIDVARIISDSHKARMLTYAHVCSRMLAYAHVCSRIHALVNGATHPARALLLSLQGQYLVYYLIYYPVLVNDDATYPARALLLYL